MSPNLREQLFKLPDYLGHHLTLSVAALVTGIALAVPSGLLTVRRERAQRVVLAVSSLVQTIPGLALLALMVPLLGTFGFVPAFIALVLYSTLPILRNTVTGIAGVDPRLIEAATALGMRPRQVLGRVELPLAAPVILAGIRTAAVWVVGTATLATPVGQASLGNYIFSGLQTRNWTAVLFGCLGSAALALTLDGLIALLEGAAARRSLKRALLALVGLGALVASGLLAPRLHRVFRAPPPAPAEVAAPAPSTPSTPTPKKRLLRVGSKTYTEQYVLAQLLGQKLREKGFEVEQVGSLGSTIVFDALKDNRLDAYVDYTGTLWANGMKRSDTRPAWQVLAGVTSWLGLEHGIRCLGPLGFENAYALAMRKDRASELGVRSIGDLAPHAKSLKLGSDYEFFQRPEWRKMRDTYGLAFGERKIYDMSFLYEAVATREVDVITAYSSDGRIAALNLEVLEDSKHVFPPYDAILLLSPRVANEPEIVAALEPLVGAIRVEKMREANWMVDRAENKKTPAEAAAWLLSEISR